MAASTLTAAPEARRAPIFTPGMLAWFAFLGLALFIGLIAAYQVLTEGLVVTNLSDGVPWGLWITIDLSAIALGAGAFTLSAVVYLFGLKSFQSIVRLAVYVGFIGYTSALLTLVMDIGRPDRFWHPWVYWNIHSVLWEITWCITIYLTILMIEFAPVIAELPFFARWPVLKKIAHGIHRAAPVLAVAGLLISLLHQSSLGATYGVLRSRPIWFKPSMPIMFIVSAMATGPALTMAAAIVIQWITGRRVVPPDVLRTIARFSGLGLLAYLYIKMWDLAAVSYYGRTPAADRALFVLNEYTPYGFGFWVGEILLGLVIPIILFLVPRFRRRPSALVAGSLLATAGIVIHRWNVTVSGLVVPLAYSPGSAAATLPQPYTPSLAEWGIALGVVGYALLMFTLGVKFLPLFDRHPASRPS
ncbi:MAG TPA: NrfD/PsrC family molybdoenzyme membrane anchor subunit [Anaerolineales bacterium]|nr:NrfD/PsrC family molybdoenzyme membrane anchor subunit [Anaerolineales bacterium]